jgi:DNA-binding protein Fis
MNGEKATSTYQGRLQVGSYSAPSPLEPGASPQASGQPRDFADESFARTDRLAESIRLKLLKVLTLTLLRELEGVGNERSRPVAEFDLQSEVQHFEAELIRSALIMTGGRQRRAAKLLGMKVTTLHSKIRRYGLNDATIAEATSRHEPSAVEAVRTSLELVESMFEADPPDLSDTSPEIHVTGEN